MKLLTDTGQLIDVFSTVLCDSCAHTVDAHVDGADCLYSEEWAYETIECDCLFFANRSLGIRSHATLPTGSDAEKICTMLLNGEVEAKDLSVQQSQISGEYFVEHGDIQVGLAFDKTGRFQRIYNFAGQDD